MHDRYPPAPGAGNRRPSGSHYAPPPPPPPSHHSPPPPPPPPPPPSANLPSRPPPSWHSRESDRRDSYYRRDDRQPDYSFRGPYSDLRNQSNGQSYRDHDRDYDYDRNRNRDDYRPPQGDFTFRAQAPAGLDNARHDSYAPPRHHRDNDNHLPNRPSHRGNHNNRGGRGSRVGRGRGNHSSHNGGPRKPHEKAADRLFLSKRHDEKPEFMLGDTTIRASYRDVDDLSDSDDVDMDISDNGEPNEATQERPTKRIRTDDTQSAAHEVPKWSNPDPYTALPPPETTRKKDVVQLIRKARVDAEVKKTDTVSDAADFISFELSDDEDPKQGKTNNAANRPAAKGSSTKPIVDRHRLPPPPFHTPQSTEDQHPNNAHAPPQHSMPPPAGTKNGKKGIVVDLIPTASLGNRKRTADDQIKLPHASMKKVNRMASTGALIYPWEPVPNEDPCPWAVIDHSSTPNMGTRLHKELVDFYEYVRPRDFEEKVRGELVDALSTLIKKKHPDAEILPFGSFMSGLYLPTADMDIAVCSQSLINHNEPRFHSKKTFWGLKAHLESHEVAFENKIEPVSRAKVPLLKYTDNYTGLKVDISFEKMDGYKAINTFLKWRKQYPAMPALVAFLKQFLLMRGLNEPVNGGIGGFTVICMVVHVLQGMPQVQSASMKPEEHLGETLMEILDYYGNRHEYETVAISMMPPRLVHKKEASTIVYRNLDRLSIIDPNNPDNDISGGSSNYWVIKDRFAEAYKLLRDRMERFALAGLQTKALSSQDTLLYPLIGGKYSNFIEQREYLEKLAAHRPVTYAKRSHKMKVNW
ncbi:hypothetical protein F5Y16DRAFT_380212 [Xylariaceae sp. FL0255]|nr:hypothetical protein F5Y16DRAFT_380212 [Xylariaceae sp. FL0255]